MATPCPRARPCGPRPPHALLLRDSRKSSSWRLTASAWALNLRQTSYHPYQAPERGPDPGIASGRSTESEEAHSSIDSARDMEPPPGRCHEDAGYLSLGVDELQEEPHDTKPPEIWDIVTGKAVEEDPGSEPEQGAAAAAAAGEQGLIGAEAPDPMDDEGQKGGGGGGGDDDDGEEFPQQQQQPIHAATEDPQDRPPRLHRSPFPRLQLTELERVFRCTQYPDVFERKKLVIGIEVTKETGVPLSKPENNNSAGQPR